MSDAMALAFGLAVTCALAAPLALVDVDKSPADDAPTTYEDDRCRCGRE